MKTRQRLMSTVMLAGWALAGCQSTTPPPATPAASTPMAVASATQAPADLPTAAGSVTPSTTPAVSASASGTPRASGSPAADKGSGVPLQDTLTPLPDKVGKTPVITKKSTITMTTSAGDVVIEVYPEAAPNAVERFVELSENGFYNDTPVSRVVKTPSPFVAQFGINWRPTFKDWEKKNFKDDPSLFSLERGTLAFAKKGPDSNSTQVFINYQQNNQLADPSYNFAAFGKVVKGMDIVDNFMTVGDAGEGLDQLRLWNDGGNYLDSLTTKPTMIEKMTVTK